ncbi:MAG: hypothetical protein B6229_00460 [Spirochaetaceae bacterium 4572_7]|nr:MAG: hypothetical protein B6229_00460 [Spirochaetaceae bacterium 4572_7]
MIIKTTINGTILGTTVLGSEYNGDIACCECRDNLKCDDNQLTNITYNDIGDHEEEELLYCDYCNVKIDDDFADNIFAKRLLNEKNEVRKIHNV